MTINNTIHTIKGAFQIIDCLNVCCRCTYLRAPAISTDDDEVMKTQLTQWWLFLLLGFFFFCLNKNMRKIYDIYECVCLCKRVFHRVFPLFLLTDYSRTILNFQQTEELNLLHWSWHRGWSGVETVCMKLLVQLESRAKVTSLTLKGETKTLSKDGKGVKMNEKKVYSHSES